MSVASLQKWYNANIEEFFSQKTTILEPSKSILKRNKALKSLQGLKIEYSSTVNTWEIGGKKNKLANIYFINFRLNTL